MNVFSSSIIKGKDALQRFPAMLTEAGVSSVFVYADKNTLLAAGEKVVQLLKAAGIKVKEYVFTDEHIEPNESAVGLAVMHFDPTVDAVVAVGSGVINDISKIVANVSGKRYIIVATAPSMDGYASATSSMSVDGLKISLNSKCADMIVGDTEILRNAPIKMMISGLGDMLAKYVAICEWRISALITGEAFSTEVADMVRRSLARCVENAEGLLKRDPLAVEAVFEGLVLCGNAMKLAGCSRPASGIEHYLSHIWDMRGEAFGTKTELHGIQCAVGTYIAVDLYEKIKKCKPDRERAVAYARSFCYSDWAKELSRFLGKGADAMIALERKEQKYDVARHAARIDRIISVWDEILKVIEEELPRLDRLTALYDSVGLPKSMKEIGIDEDILPMTFKAAKDIRDKYVLPRLAWDLGVLDDIIRRNGV